MAYRDAAQRSKRRCIGAGASRGVLGQAPSPAALLLAASLVIPWAARASEEAAPAFPLARIAHAGGAIDGVTYTNSYEALDRSLERGFTHFELDFSFTSDGALVCIHDWEHSFERSFGFTTTEKPTLAIFAFLARQVSKYHKCTLDGLVSWMKEHPSAVLVTDVKEENLRALGIIAGHIPHSQERVIPQIYYPESFREVKDMGYASIIWTLYRYPGTDEDVTSWAERFTGPVAVTMSKERAASELPRSLERKGVPTYVHTVNDSREALVFMQQHGVSEIYTDSLAPLPHGGEPLGGTVPADSPPTEP